MAGLWVNVVCLLALTSQLSAQGISVSIEAVDTDYYYDYGTDHPTIDYEWIMDDWLYELEEVTEMCDPNPCLNGGSCTSENGAFQCHCPEPYTGRKCQTMKDVCKNVKCGQGDCVRKSTEPFYECKCRPPFRPPKCTKASHCKPNPCVNSGSCIQASKGFQCFCPDGYSGKYCHVGPDDCYQGEGETYRGSVSETVDGEDCLDWNSHLVALRGLDPFQTFGGFDGIGPHNFCRNPDGDDKPWCYIKKNGKLEWNYCPVRKCSSVPVTPPTVVETDATTAPPVRQFSQCGKPQPGRSTRIFGGKKSIPGAHPWQVSLQIKPAGSAVAFSHLCGGILLDSCWVLTAAHCIKTAVDMQVVVGGVDLRKVEEYEQVIPVKKAYAHKDYRDTGAALHNDVAMLELEQTDSPYCAKETRFVKTACMPPAQPFSGGTKCVVSGWGATETPPGDPSNLPLPIARIYIGPQEKYGTNQLLDASVLLISEEKCRAPHVYGNILDDSMICAGVMQGGVDSCAGDSGGPLTCERDGTHYVIGVTSWGEGCGKKYKPGVYANVRKFADWISQHMVPPS